MENERGDIHLDIKFPAKKVKKNVKKFIKVVQDFV